MVDIVGRLYSAPISCRREEVENNVEFFWNKCQLSNPPRYLKVFFFFFSFEKRTANKYWRKKLRLFILVYFAFAFLLISEFLVEKKKVLISGRKYFPFAFEMLKEEWWKTELSSLLLLLVVATHLLCYLTRDFWKKKKKIIERVIWIPLNSRKNQSRLGCWYCCIEYFFFHLFLPCLVFITECAIPLLGAISQPGQATYMGTIKYTDTAVPKSRCCTMCRLPGSVVLSLVSTHQPYSGSYWLRLGKARQWKGRSTVQPSVLYCRQESGK